jgi:hypothetical protein
LPCFSRLFLVSDRLQIRHRRFDSDQRLFLRRADRHGVARGLELLARGRLTVVDGTNVQPEARSPLVQLARQSGSDGSKGREQWKDV